MSLRWLLVMTLIAMGLFAANSLLGRLALTQTSIDPVSFATLRIISGAVVLWAIVRCRRSDSGWGGSWICAAALLVYAVLFSCAYVALSAAAGALLLFCAVQLTMIIGGMRMGERLGLRQGLGALLALAGLFLLLLPGAAAPSLSAAAMMLAAGVAWGVYSLGGRTSHDPIAQTAGNFVRAAPVAVVLCVLTLPWARIDGAGAAYAVASGTIASGIGYAIWYSVLPGLKSTSAATVQLSVPVIAAIGGSVFIAEPITTRLVICSAVILAGIALVAVPRVVVDNTREAVDRRVG